MKIKKLLKLTSSIFVLLLIALVTFFFWASSTNHNESEYSQLIENNYSTNDDNDSVYSIITYNIGYLSGLTNNLPVPKPKELFGNNLKKVSQEFEKLNPDIICFQEIDYHSNRSYFVNQQEAIEKLGYNYVFQAVNWDVNYLPFPYYPIKYHFGETYSGQSILSKYPIKEQERIVLDRVENTSFLIDAFYLDRLAQVSKVILDGRTVILINVHFEAFDEETRTNHANYIINTYNKYKNDYPILIAGDFNSDVEYDNSAIQIILDLPSIKNAVDTKEKTYPSISPTDRLDYIFYNEDFIELKSSSIITSFGDGSDHLPVIMEFKLKI